MDNGQTTEQINFDGDVYANEEQMEKKLKEENEYVEKFHYEIADTAEVATEWQFFDDYGTLQFQMYVWGNQASDTPPEEWVTYTKVEKTSEIEEAALREMERDSELVHKANRIRNSRR